MVVLALVAGGAAWVSWARHRAGATTGSWAVQDGHWARVTRKEAARLARERATRPADKVRVTGTVRDGDGRPVPGAEVSLVGDAGSVEVQAPRGSYDTFVAPGFYRIFARADGLVAVGRAGAPRVPAGAEVGAAPELAPTLGLFRDLDAVDLEMRAAGRIDGTVTGPDGAPVSGAVVRAIPAAADAPRPIAGSDVGVTNDRGHFSLTVPAGSYAIDADDANLVGLTDPQTRNVAIGADGTERVALHLTRGCIIRGVVRRADGSPAGEGSLELEDPSAGDTDFAAATQIDAHGAFRLARRSPGAVRVRAHPWKSPPSAAVDVSCSDGARPRIDLVVADERPDVNGRLIDETGRGLAHRFVNLMSLDGAPSLQERTDGDGTFAFYRVPSGRWRVTAFDDDHGAASATITSPLANVVLSMSGTGVLTGQIDGIDDGSFTLEVSGCLTAAGARAARAVPPRVYLVPVEHGRYQIGGLPACSLDATARAAGRVVPLSATIEPDAVVAVDLQLGDAARGRAGHQPVAGALGDRGRARRQ